MMKKIALFVILLMLVILVSSCQTTKGVATGIAQGVKQDTLNTYNFLAKIDAWFKDRFW